MTKETNDIWEELNIDQQIAIDIALEEVKRGQTVPFETIVAKHK